MISMKNSIVELDGDEMAYVMWSLVKEKLILPYVELKEHYFDTGIENRNLTNDEVLKKAIDCIFEAKVFVKCATITPNAEKMKELGLKTLLKSANGIIKANIDGTNFRTPIIVKGIEPVVKNWKKPITIARHTYGDFYINTELAAEKNSRGYLVYTAENGCESRLLIHSFDDDTGVLQAQHNTEKSIKNFAKSCFELALCKNEDLYFSALSDISKLYDKTFEEIFENTYETYKPYFEKAGIKYRFMTTGHASARVMRSAGGFIWALKNYDGDVQSDMVASAFGSLSMMTSVFVSPDGIYEYEAPHGTVTRHFYKFLKGETVYTNPVATIFAWTGALRKRGELDDTPKLCDFSDRLEKAVTEVIESGRMTEDIAEKSVIPKTVCLDTFSFVDAVKEQFEYDIQK